MVQINHHIDLKFAMHSIKYTVYVVHCTVYIVKCYFCIPALPEAPRISSLQPTADRVAATLKSWTHITPKMYIVQFPVHSPMFLSIVQCSAVQCSIPT